MSVLVSVLLIYLFRWIIIEYIIESPLATWLYINLGSLPGSFSDTLFSTLKSTKQYLIDLLTDYTKKVQMAWTSKALLLMNSKTFAYFSIILMIFKLPWRCILWLTRLYPQKSLSGPFLFALEGSCLNMLSKQFSRWEIK